MFSYLLNVIPPMLLGAQCILFVIYLEGDICPGQRGRLHKQLLIMTILWFAASLLYWQFAFVAIALFLYFTKVKVRVTRDSDLIWILFVALGLAVAFNVVMLLHSQPAQRLFIVCSTILLGASLGHVLLLFAKTRLQAFHRLLPITSIVGAMLTSLAVLWQIQDFSAGYLNQNIWYFVICYSLMIVGVISSSWHLFTRQATHKFQPCCGFILNLIAMAGFAKLLY